MTVTEEMILVTGSDIERSTSLGAVIWDNCLFADIGSGISPIVVRSSWERVSKLEGR